MKTYYDKGVYNGVGHTDFIILGLFIGEQILYWLVWEICGWIQAPVRDLLR